MISIYIYVGEYLKTTVADANRYLAKALVMPILKTPEDKNSMRMAAISSNKNSLLTLTNPNAISFKKSSVIAAGCYSAYHSLELYTEIFEQLDVLDKLENFTSYFGSVFYKEPSSKNKATLIKSSWQVPKTLPLGTEAVVQ